MEAKQSMEARELEISKKMAQLAELEYSYIFKCISGHSPDALLQSSL